MNFKILRNKILIAGTLVTSIVYLVWRIFFTIPLEYGPISSIAGLILLFVEMIGMIEEIIHFKNMSDIVIPKRPQVDEKMFPDVDVFIATYNEPADLLYKTVNGCLNMDYPDKSKVHIFICDDGDRAEMRNLAKKMEINYITRKERKHAKAGNLNNAMKNSSSPLIATFDADMIPMHDFLMASVPYFIETLSIKNEQSSESIDKIGFIQMPQSFYNPDLFQYYLFAEGRIPNEQDYFYRDIEVAKNKSNSVIYGGSNTLILRKALDEIGGFYTKVITEDFATGMLIQSKGYKCYAIDEIHASGLAPSDLKSLIKQRERWGRGCIQTGRKLNIMFRKGLNLNQKLSYLSAISYWHASFKRAVYIISPILYGTFGIVVVKCTTFQVLSFWLPMYLFNNCALKLLSNNIRNVKWSNIYETILFPSLILKIFLESIGISQNKFSVTKKDKKIEEDDDSRYKIRKSIPHIILAALSLLGIFKSIKLTFYLGSPIYAILLFWLVINFYNLVMSIFFMLGRKMYRQSERFFIDTECEVIYEYQGIIRKINCKTYDISEGGAAIKLDFPRYIPYDNDVIIKLKTKRYQCEFKGQIVQIQQINFKWKYAFKLMNIEEKNYRELLNIIYDREPTLPKSIKKSNSIFDDIVTNISRRVKKSRSYSRKLPRINLDKIFDSLECGRVKIVNFNYEYALIRTDASNRCTEKLTIKINEHLYLKCRLGRDIKNEEYEAKIYSNNDDKLIYSHLYVVENYLALINNDEFESLLKTWIKEYNLRKIKEENRRRQLKKKFIPEDEFDEMSKI